MTVIDSTGASLFQVEHDDTSMDANFANDQYVPGCKGYQACKEKWYFDQLPKQVAGAIQAVDQSNQPLETWQQGELVFQAGGFLSSRGISGDRRAAILDEMVGLLHGRFEKLYIPADPLTEATTFMYVPSVGLFVPYWHA